MRIAVIRGRNIASLAGPFEVRLDAAPLEQVGLFAITGPTGAGKSTLLDCVCLALFDKVPRLRLASSRSKVRGLGDDDEEYAATDPRGLLRRGTGAGFAEVEFVDTAGARWRARWSVRRSRDRPDGRLQTSDVSLFDSLDNVIAQGRKTDVLAAIEERLGLGFEQFRRAALLAQGEFAAFLHADPNDRATVLERVTGTDLYARISAAAYERWRAEREALAVLDVRLQEVGVLPAEERADKEQARAAVELHRAQLEKGRSQANEAIAWHRKSADHLALVQQAETRAAAAKAAWDEGTAAREELAAIDAVASLRGDLQAVDAARERRSNALLGVKAAETAEANARAAQEAARRSEGQARTSLERARSELEEAEPDLARARSLDAEIGEALRVAAARQEEAQAASELARQAEGRVQAVADQVAQLERAQREATEWLDARAPIATLVERWGDLDRGLVRLAEARAALLEHSTALGALRPRLEAARTQVAARSETHLQAEVAFRRLTAEVAAAATAVPDGARAALNARRGDLDRRRSHLHQAQRILQALSVRQGELARATGRAEAASLAMTEAAAAVARHREAAATAVIRLEEARDGLQRLRAARSLETHRAHLVDGTPCPLCGATTHPWAAEGAPEERMLQAQEQRVRELDTALEQARDAAARAETEGTSAAAQREQALAEVQAAQAGIDTHRSDWGTLRQSAAFLAEEPDADALAALEQELAAEAAAVEAEERALEAAEAALRGAREALETGRTHLDAETRHLGSERDLVHRLSADEAALARQHEAEAARVREREADLEPALAPLVPWPPDDVAAARVEVGGLIDKAGDRLATLRTAERELATCRASGAEAAAVVATHAADLTSREQAAALAQARVAELRQARQALFGGRPTAEVGEALARRAREAQEALSAAVEARSEHVAAAAGAQARLEEARADLAGAVTALGAAEEALDAALAPLDLDEAGLRSRLTRSADEVRQLREEQSRLQGEVVQTAAVVGERQRASADHHRGATPPPRELVEANLGRIEHEWRQVQQEEAQLLADLKADDAARARATTLDAERAAQDATLATWATLKDLIGSQDGRSFKRFAQSLTLDALLAHANRHLDDLAPRFRLIRVPQSELDLQVVDRTMGDEVRAVHTLSGGETFLASLALALGLASLSATDTPVDSLFIDEGFGTLDRETLDTALAALDALQATGRQVGIISHVAGLAERIGVQVQVQPQGAGRSRVQVLSA